MKVLDVDSPPNWGEIERSIPDLGVPDDFSPVQLPVALRAAGSPVAPWVAALLSLATGAVLVMCVLLAANAGARADTAGLLVGAQIAAVVLLAFAFTPVAASADNRLRSTPALITTAAAFVISAIALAIAISSLFPVSSWFNSADVSAWTPWIIAGACVVSAVALAIMIFGRKRAVTVPTVDRSQLSAEAETRLTNRAILPEELVKRQKVSRIGIDTTAMTDVPLGTWGLLDQNPR